MSGLLAALQRLEGRGPASGETPADAPKPLEVPSLEQAVFALEHADDEVCETATDTPTQSGPTTETEKPRECIPWASAETAGPAETPLSLDQLAEFEATAPTGDELPGRPATGDDPTAFAKALTSACREPALVAFVTVGIEESVTPLLRSLAEAVAGYTHRDVLLLGPGLLDHLPAVVAQKRDLVEQRAFGFVHAASEFALARLDALSQVAAVVPVVELGRSAKPAVEQLVSSLSARGIRVLGSVVVRG